MIKKSILRFKKKAGYSIKCSADTRKAQKEQYKIQLAKTQTFLDQDLSTTLKDLNIKKLTDEQKNAVKKILTLTPASESSVFIGELEHLVNSFDVDEMTNKKLRYLFSYHTTIPFLHPKNISLDTSTKCNLRCRICNQWRDKNEYVKLTVGDIKKLIDQISEYFPNTFLEFSGQEPLLNTELLLPVLNYGTKKGVTLALSTNGMLLTDELATKLISFNFNHISISLDSIKAPMHDHIRNKKGAHKQIIEGVKNLVKQKKLQKSKVSIALTFVITNLNFKDILTFHEFANKLGVDCVNYNPYTIDNSYFFKKNLDYEDDEFWITKTNIPALKRSVKQLVDLKKQNKVPVITNSISQLEAIPDYFKKKRNFQKGFCLAGYNYFHITNFGEVTVCGKGPGLNIKDCDIRQIWNNYYFWQTRVKTGQCRMPCLNNCFDLI